MIRNTPEVLEAFNPNGGKGSRTIEWSVVFSFVDENIEGKITPSAQEDVSISRISQTVERDQIPFNAATFEQNNFPLDGSVLIPPRVSEALTTHMGLWMPILSDDNGFFTEPQRYTATTQNKYDLIAITINWGYTPAVDFTVSWFADSDLLLSVPVVGNTLQKSLISYAVQGVNRVEIEITRTLPFHRCRIAEFVPGAILLYDRANSESLSIEEVADPFNERTVSNSMTVLTDNFAKQFNIFDPAGVYAYFRNRMPLHPQIGARNASGAMEYINMGTYYLQAPALKGNLSKLELKAVNLMGLLQDTIYRKGVYRSGSIASFIDDIANDAEAIVSYPERLKSIEVWAYLSTQPHAKALATLAQATNTCIVVSRDNKIQMLEIGTSSLQTLNQDDYRMGNGFAPSDDVIVNTVLLEVSNPRVEVEVSELVKVPATGTIQSSIFFVDNAIITTSSDVYAPSYSPSTEHTASIVGDEIVISGKKIENSTHQIEKTIRQPNEASYAYELKANLFIQGANAHNVGDYFLGLKARNRRKVKLEYRGYPYLEMADTVDFNAGSDNTQVFFTTKNRLKLGGGMNGTMEAHER